MQKELPKYNPHDTYVLRADTNRVVEVLMSGYRDRICKGLPELPGVTNVAFYVSSVRYNVKSDSEFSLQKHLQEKLPKSRTRLFAIKSLNGVTLLRERKFHDMHININEVEGCDESHEDKSEETAEEVLNSEVTKKSRNFAVVQEEHGKVVMLEPAEKFTEEVAESKNPFPGDGEYKLVSEEEFAELERKYNGPFQQAVQEAVSEAIAADAVAEEVTEMGAGEIQFSTLSTDRPGSDLVEEDVLELEFARDHNSEDLPLPTIEETVSEQDSEPEPEPKPSLLMRFDSILWPNCPICRTARAWAYFGMTFAFSLNAIALWFVYQAVK